MRTCTERTDRNADPGRPVSLLPGFAWSHLQATSADTTRHASVQCWAACQRGLRSISFSWRRPPTPRPTMLRTLVLAFCTCLIGCGSAPTSGPVTKVNFDRIKADGTEDLPTVEAIMGGKGTELPKAAWVSHGISPLSLPFRKAKLIDGNLVADDSGPEARVFRWGDERRLIIIATQGDKVVYKSMREQPTGR